MQQDDTGDAAARPGLSPSVEPARAVSPADGASIPIADQLAAIKDEADSVLFHQLCCMGGCGESMPSMARLARLIGFEADPATGEEIDAALTSPPGYGRRSHECFRWQQEEALKVVVAARAYRQAETDGTPRMWRGKALQDLATALDEAIAAYDEARGIEAEGDAPAQGDGG